MQQYVMPAGSPTALPTRRHRSAPPASPVWCGRPLRDRPDDRTVRRPQVRPNRLLDDDLYLHHREATVPGKLLIFPAGFFHYATKNESSEPRLTLSFNSFPDGFVTAGGVSRMRIKVL